MKKFKYRAKKGPNEVVQGVLAAESQDAAVDKLSGMGLLPVEVNEETVSLDEISWGLAMDTKRVRSRDVATFYRQLARLVKSGVPIVSVLTILAEQSSNQALRNILENVRNQVREGHPFSSSLAVYPHVFSAFDIAMIQAGESTGHLEISLVRIGDYREAAEELSSKLRTALVYPAFILSVGIVTVCFMLGYVIPKFSKFFTDLGQDLPGITRFLIHLSQGIQAGWIWILLGSAVTVFLIKKYLQSHREKWHEFLLQCPKAGKIILMSEIARFSRALELLLHSHITLLNALKIALPVLGNESLKKELKACGKVLEQGGYLSEGLRKSRWFPPFVVHWIRVGEESGRLDEILGEIANWYEQETARFVKLATQLIEPSLILLIGLILGFIVIAVLMPVFSMNAIIS